MHITGGGAMTLGMEKTRNPAVQYMSMVARPVNCSYASNYPTAPTKTTDASCRNAEGYSLQAPFTLA